MENTKNNGEINSAVNYSCCADFQPYKLTFIALICHCKESYIKRFALLKENFLLSVSCYSFCHMSRYY
jgi:hypothetical protein